MEVGLNAAMVWFMWVCNNRRPMDVIIRFNNNPVNDMNELMSWIVNYMDKFVKTKSSQVRMVCDCSGSEKWIFMSPTRQTSSGRLLMYSRWWGSCSVNMESARLSRRLGGGRYPKKCSVLCCKVFDASTTSNDVWVKSMLVLNVMLGHKIY